MNRNSTLFGFCMGVVAPVLGFFLVRGAFDLMVNFNLMDYSSMDMGSKRLRTVTLIAICFNILLLQRFKSKQEAPVVKGIAMATMLYAGVWVFMFAKSLFI